VITIWSPVKVKLSCPITLHEGAWGERMYSSY
jgi:hypothetical protein